MLAVCALGAPATAAAAPKYRAQITRTTGGIPHITAGSYGSAGYGVAYAYAQDNFCTLAQQVVTTRARRSLYFGPNGHTIASAQSSNNNLESDFYWQQIKDRRLVEKQLARKAPAGPGKNARAMLRGYVAGYNAYLRKVGVNGIPDPRCRGKSWVKPITIIDAWRRAYQLSLLGSGTVFIPEQIAAVPPTTAARTARASRAVSPAAAAAWWHKTLRDDHPIGSNGLGLGSQGTKAGDGMLLANPHFPWIGSERFYQFGLHVPGKLNVQGSSLGGAPIVNIGFNRHTAWTHTVSTGRRFTVDRLDLVPGSPTSYRYDGKTLKLTSRTVKVPIKGGGTRSHTFWYSRTGILANVERAGFVWDKEHAYALHDANATNLRLIDVWLAMDKAKSVQGLVSAQSRIQGVPWVNTIAADDKGRALYQDNSVTPHVTTAQIKSCIPAGLPALVYQAANVITLDGSTSKCAWGKDKDAVEPGIFGRSHLPVLIRRDFVQNSNDSFWLSNPHHPLTGFSPIIGLTGTQQGERTRYGVRYVEKRLAGTDGRKGKRFSLADLRGIWSRFDSEGGRLLHKQVAALCRANPMVTLASGAKVDVSAACPVFDKWNARATLDSKGAWLFSLWWANSGSLYRDAFDPQHPLTTPSLLDPSQANVQAIGLAVKSLHDHGLPVDATMRQAQYVKRNGKRIPLPGCNSGCYANISAVVDAAGASQSNGVPVKYGQVVDGSSTVMQVELTPKGPKGTTILTYSESENPASKRSGTRPGCSRRGSGCRSRSPSSRSPRRGRAGSSSRAH